MARITLQIIIKNFVYIYLNNIWTLSKSDNPSGDAIDTEHPAAF